MGACRIQKACTFGMIWEALSLIGEAPKNNAHIAPVQKKKKKETAGVLHPLPSAWRKRGVVVGRKKKDEMPFYYDLMENEEKKSVSFICSHCYFLSNPEHRYCIFECVDTKR